MTPTDLTRLDAQLQRLHLHYIQSHYQALATRAAEQQRSHLDYLEQLVEGEATMRENRSIERRIKNARFPVLKSLDDFQWNWPKKINRPQIQNLFRLAFIATQTNVVLIGNVGLGKTHLSIALGHAACLNGHSVLFTTAVDIINIANLAIPTRVSTISTAPLTNNSFIGGANDDHQDDEIVQRMRDDGGQEVVRRDIDPAEIAADDGR